MPARPPFLHGFCKGGRLERAGANWHVLFQGKDPLRKKCVSLKEAKRIRRLECKRRGTVVNPWRLWPDDIAHKTVQMLLANKHTVLVEDEIFDVVASRLWKVRSDGFIISTGKYRNTRAGVNAVTPPILADTTHPTLKTFLYSKARTRFKQKPYVDSDGFTCHDFRLSNVL